MPKVRQGISVLQLLIFTETWGNEMNAQDIRTHAATELAALDWDAVAAIMNRTNLPVRNPHAYTIGELSEIVGLEGAAVVAYTIDKAGEEDTPMGGLMSSIGKAVSTVGVSLHTDERQGMIDQLAVGGGWPDVLRDAIKSAGVTYVSLAGEVVTAEQCKAVIVADTKATVIENVITAITAKANNITASLGDEHTGSLTIVELEARIAALMASVNGLVE